MTWAVLPNRNESNWSTSSSSHHQHQQRSRNSNFVRNLPITNPNPNPNRNPNHNKFTDNHDNSIPRMHNLQPNNNGVDELMDVDNPRVSFSYYVNFDIATLSKSEIRSLKSRLVAELHQVRSLSSRVESDSVSKKRSPPFPASNGHSNPKRHAGNRNSVKPPQPPVYKASSNVMKMCATALRKLSNQKAGMWFNSPVDAVGMGLHDYHTVINRPMDLGTIKDRLDKHMYDTPEEFAADVRLTFNNALRYNPKGHEVNTIAGQYLALFERWVVPILAKFQTEKQQHYQVLAQRESKLVREDNVVVDVVDSEVKPSFLSNVQSFDPVKPVKPVLNPVSKPTTPSPPPPLPPPPPPPPVLEQEVVAVVERRVRKEEERLVKPKAKEANKREMSMDEKRRLGEGLQNLPEDKMAKIIQIIRKRNEDLNQEGDEIELDFEALDKETLWELDRFVTNYKKMVSKISRQGLIGTKSNDDGDVNQEVSMREQMVEMPSKAKKVGVGGGGDVGEEDVDIGDEMPVNHFPPVEIEKDDDRPQGGGSPSSSGSSGSDDSSSSDSDSGTSSGSDSDVDDAQSVDNESKNIIHH